MAPKKLLSIIIIIIVLGAALFFLPASVPGHRISLDATFQQVVLDVPPLEDNNRQLLVSANDFFPLFAATADCYREQAVLRGPSGIGEVSAGSLEAKIDGSPCLLGIAPCLVDNKFYVPLNWALKIMEPSAYEGPTSTDDIHLPPIQAQEGLHFRYYPVYDLQAKYNPANGHLQGELLLAYQNPFLKSLSELYFNLPANAAFGNGASLNINRVLVDNQPVAVNLDNGNTSLRVSLGRKLAPRETVLLAISFVTLVPEGAFRLGRGENISTLAGWYPVLAPPGGKHWAGVADVSYGEPYFTTAAHYRTQLILPAGCQVVASSRTVGHRQMDGWTVWNFDSEHPIREFAFAVSPSWQLTTIEEGPVKIMLASRGDADEAAMEMAVRALKFFQEIYGPYPYSYFNMAFVPLENLSGMEYPGLVFLSSCKPFTPSVIVHEITHQWWYNLVGNNSIEAAWIDEGLAEYSTLLFYRQYDPLAYKAKLAIIEELARMDDNPLDLPLDQYKDEQTYRRAVYNRGALFWLQMEDVMGLSKLRQALAYIQRYYRHEIVSPSALLTVISYYGRLTAGDFSSFFRN